jgi:5-methylcytosine-specific restriction endonuclease McrA
MNTHEEYYQWKKTPEFTKWKKKQFLKQGGLCWYCQDYLPLTRQNVEHKTAVSLGGRNNKNNLVLACSNCNKAKGSKHLTSLLRGKLNAQNKNNKGTYLKNKQHYTNLYQPYSEDSFVEMCKNF